MQLTCLHLQQLHSSDITRDIFSLCVLYKVGFTLQGGDCCRGEEAGGQRQRAGEVVRARGVVLPWVHVWTATMRDRLRSVHFTRRSSYYAKATKPGPTCLKEGCFNWDGTGTGDNRLTGFGSQTIDAMHGSCATCCRGVRSTSLARQLGTRMTLLDASVWTYSTDGPMHAEDWTIPLPITPCIHHPSVAELCNRLLVYRSAANTDGRSQQRDGIVIQVLQTRRLSR